MNAVSTEVGSDNAVISVERHEFRNTNTTATVRNAPKNSECTTLSRLSCASLPPSRVISSSALPACSLLMVLTSSRTSLATLTVLASRVRDT